LKVIDLKIELISFSKGKKIESYPFEKEKYAVVVLLNLL